MGQRAVGAAMAQLNLENRKHVFNVEGLKRRFTISGLGVECKAQAYKNWQWQWQPQKGSRGKLWEGF